MTTFFTPKRKHLVWVVFVTIVVAVVAMLVTRGAH